MPDALHSAENPQTSERRLYLNFGFRAYDWEIPIEDLFLTSVKTDWQCRLFGALIIKFGQCRCCGPWIEEDVGRLGANDRWPRESDFCHVSVDCRSPVLNLL